MREEWVLITYDPEKGQKSEREYGRYGDKEQAVAAANHALAWTLPENIKVTVRPVLVSSFTGSEIKKLNE